VRCVRCIKRGSTVLGQKCCAMETTSYYLFLMFHPK